MMEGGTDLVRINDLQIEEEQGKLGVEFDGANGKKGKQSVDMVVLAPAIEPREGAAELAEIFGLRLDEKGFFSEGEAGSISTSGNDIYVIGTAQGPKDIGASVAEAYAAVAEILAKGRGGGN
jgi:heterodisulfide reductase subunit A